MTDPVDNNVPHPAGPFRQQFGLGTLFYLTAVYAAGLVLGLWTIWVTTLVLFLWWLAYYRGARIVVFILIALFFLVGMLLPQVSNVREAARSTQCLNNIRQITLAMLNYESAHSKFPMAQTNHAQGKPSHSWRVEILPYLEYESLYDQYDFNEPWDGPNNIKLLTQMPKFYACPSHRNSGGLTPYKVVADQGTAFELGKTIGFADLEDGSSNTLCIVEDSTALVPWTKPSDLTIEQAVKVLACQDHRKVAHSDERGFATHYLGSNVSLLDGSTDGVGPSIEPDVVRGLCLRADGKLLDPNDLGESSQIIHYEMYFALIVYMALLSFPGILIWRSNLTGA